MSEEMKTRWRLQLTIMCIRSLSMVGETASKSDGNSEPFGSGFAEEGWQDKSLYTCRKGRCLETLKVAVLPNVLETATPDKRYVEEKRVMELDDLVKIPQGLDRLTEVIRTSFTILQPSRSQAVWHTAQVFQDDLCFDERGVPICPAEGDYEELIFCCVRNNKAGFCSEEEKLAYFTNVKSCVTCEWRVSHLRRAKFLFFSIPSFLFYFILFFSFTMIGVLVIGSLLFLILLGLGLFLLVRRRSKNLPVMEPGMVNFKVNCSLLMILTSSKTLSPTRKSCSFADFRFSLTRLNATLNFSKSRLR